MQQKENTKIIIKGKVEEIIKNIKSRQIELGCDQKTKANTISKMGHTAQTAPTQWNQRTSLSSSYPRHCIAVNKPTPLSYH